jgi:hypothetical protein
VVEHRRCDVLFNLLMLMLLSGSLMRVVSGARLEDHPTYTACLTSPSSCTSLCVPPAPVAVPYACHSSTAVLARGSGDRERLDTLPWMAFTVLPRRRSFAGDPYLTAN